MFWLVRESHHLIRAEGELLRLNLVRGVAVDQGRFVTFVSVKQQALARPVPALPAHLTFPLLRSRSKARNGANKVVVRTTHRWTTTPRPLLPVPCHPAQISDQHQGERAHWSINGKGAKMTTLRSIYHLAGGGSPDPLSALRAPRSVLRF